MITVDVVLEIFFFFFWFFDFFVPFIWFLMEFSTVFLPSWKLFFQFIERCVECVMNLSVPAFTDVRVGT